MTNRLPFSASRVIKASRALTLAEKLVWLEDQALDGLEGAWISHESLAERLGLTASSVHVLRKRLAALGLHESLPRPGARTRGWRPLLPAACRPAERPSPNEVKLLARALDDHVEDRKRALGNGRQLVMAIATRRQPRLPAASNRHSPLKRVVEVSSGAEGGASRPSSSLQENTPSSRGGNGEEGAFDRSNARSGDRKLTRIGDDRSLQRFLA